MNEIINVSISTIIMIIIVIIIIIIFVRFKRLYNKYQVYLYRIEFSSYSDLTQIYNELLDESNNASGFMSYYLILALLNKLDNTREKINPSHVFSLFNKFSKNELLIFKKHYEGEYNKNLNVYKTIQAHPNMQKSTLITKKRCGDYIDRYNYICKLISYREKEQNILYDHIDEYDSEITAF